MKLLKPGIKDPNWDEEFRCQSCGALQLVSIPDLFFEGNGVLAQYGFQCTECNGVNYLEDYDQTNPLNKNLLPNNIPHREEWDERQKTPTEMTFAQFQQLVTETFGEVEDLSENSRITPLPIQATFSVRTTVADLPVTVILKHHKEDNTWSAYTDRWCYSKRSVSNIHSPYEALRLLSEELLSLT